jgi:hypothetical protein
VHSDLPGCIISSIFVTRILFYVTLASIIIFDRLDAIRNGVRPRKYVSTTVVVVIIVEISLGKFLAVNSWEEGFCTIIEAFKSKELHRIFAYLLVHSA